MSCSTAGSRSSSSLRLASIEKSRSSGSWAKPRSAAALDHPFIYQQTETDRRDDEKQFPLLTGQFLIDRHGVIRWMNIECQREGPEGLGSFPTQEELLAAAADVS
jgi:hypothetical protein